MSESEVNVINLCCLCLQETVLQPISAEQLEFLSVLVQFQIDSNDISLACPGCLKRLDDVKTFANTARSCIQGYVEIFKNLIVYENEDLECASLPALAEVHDDGNTEPEIEELDESVLQPPEPSAVGQQSEIVVETLEEKIQRIMDASSDEEMSYVVESLEPPKRARLPKVRPVLRCETCGKEFDKLSRMLEHERSHSDQKLFACSHPGCDRRFKSKQSHRDHESSHTGYPMYCAFGCGRGFTSNKNKQNHEAVHTNDRPFGCDLCDKRYIQKRALDDHYLRQHASSTMASLPCEICGKLFRLRSALNTHLRTHSDERRFKCKLCPLAYKHSSHLRDHEKTHKEAEHNCPICDTKFVLKQSLKRHLRYHDGSRNHPCPLESCSKSFVEKCDLAKHMRTHAGLKPDKHSLFEMDPTA